MYGQKNSNSVTKDSDTRTSSKLTPHHRSDMRGGNPAGVRSSDYGGETGGGGPGSPCIAAGGGGG